MSLSNTYETHVLNYVFTTTSVSRPTAWYLAGNAWGTVTHVGVFTAATSGDLIVHSALTTSKAVAVGDVLRVNAGEIDITLD